MDVSTYRSAEQAGKRAINAIRLWTIHNPVHFDGHGFPVRADGLDRAPGPERSRAEVARRVAERLRAVG